MFTLAYNFSLGLKTDEKACQANKATKRFGVYMRTVTERISRKSKYCWVAKHFLMNHKFFVKNLRLIISKRNSISDDAVDGESLELLEKKSVDTAVIRAIFIFYCRNTTI